MYSGDGKAGRSISGDGHVRLVERRRIGKRGKWIDVYRLVSYEPETKPAYLSMHLQSRRNCGSRSAERNQDTRCEMRPGRHAVPSIHVNSEKDRLSKEMQILPVRMACR